LKATSLFNSYLGKSLKSIICALGFISCLIVSGLVPSILLGCDFVLDSVARGYAQILLEGAGFIVWARVCLRGS
jgi:hypothetical protein